MQLFSVTVDATIFLRKFSTFLCPPKHKKPASKVAHNPTRPRVLISAIFCFVEMRLFFSSLKLSNFAGWI